MFHYVQAHALNNQLQSQLGDHCGFTATYLDFSPVLAAGPPPPPSPCPFSRTPRASQQWEYKKKGQNREQPNAWYSGTRERVKKETGPTAPADPLSSAVFILTLKNRKVGTELIPYFSDTSGTASASNFKIKDFKHDYKKVLFHYFHMYISFPPLPLQVVDVVYDKRLWHIYI